MRTVYYVIKHAQANVFHSSYERTNLSIADFKKLLIKRHDIEGMGFSIQVSSKGYQHINLKP